MITIKNLPTIHHLCVGSYVFINKGYNDATHPGKYVYEVYGNIGDLYKVNGTSDLLGKIIFSKSNEGFGCVGRYAIENYNPKLLKIDAIEEVIQLLGTTK